MRILPSGQLPIEAFTAEVAIQRNPGVILLRPSASAKPSSLLYCEHHLFASNQTKVCVVGRRTKSAMVHRRLSASTSRLWRVMSTSAHSISLI